MDNKILFPSSLIVLLIACSEVPEPQPPPSGQVTSRIVLAELFTETG